MAKASRFGFNFMSSKPKYTPAEKKGEINELKAQIKSADAERDQVKKRECLKKVLAYMTLGIDTSGLFTEMIMACATKDLVQKKMVYLYLCSHAETNPDLALLAINTLQRDCADENPLVRGLALRSISSLRIPQVVEYVVPLLKVALDDKIPYVRKTAVIASCKLWKMDSEAFDKLSIREKLHTMIRDSDAHVRCNSLQVLEEIMAEEGGIQMNKQLLYPLLNKLQDLNEWQKCLVINMVLKYTPENETEMFNIMNILEESLWGSNSAVILATTHLFLNLTQNLPQLHRQVYSRLKEPLLTLIATAPMETAYTCLCHLKLLISREPEVFADKYKDFYCRYTDPSFTKSLKLEILVLIANEKNYQDIMTELAADVTDVQQETVRNAIRAMGEIALKTNAGQTAVGHFLGFLEMEMGGFVRSETLNVLKDFLRKYTDPALVKPFFPVITNHWKELDDTPSKVAFVWIMGEFGEHIEDSPYILETFCQNFKDEPHQVRLEILTACMKLVFKRPGEMQPILGNLLHEAISDFSHADVHDRYHLHRPYPPPTRAHTTGPFCTTASLRRTCGLPRPSLCAGRIPLTSLRTTRALRSRYATPPYTPPPRPQCHHHLPSPQHRTSCSRSSTRFQSSSTCRPTASSSRARTCWARRRRLPARRARRARRAPRSLLRRTPTTTRSSTTASRCVCFHAPRAAFPFVCVSTHIVFAAGWSPRCRRCAEEGCACDRRVPAVHG